MPSERRRCELFSSRLKRARRCGSLGCALLCPCLNQAALFVAKLGLCRRRHGAFDHPLSRAVGQRLGRGEGVELHIAFASSWPVASFAVGGKNGFDLHLIRDCKLHVAPALKAGIVLFAACAQGDDSACRQYPSSYFRSPNHQQHPFYRSPYRPLCKSLQDGNPDWRRLGVGLPIPKLQSVYSVKNRPPRQRH